MRANATPNATQITEPRRAESHKLNLIYTLANPQKPKIKYISQNHCIERYV